jgi:site-specific DNA recombinase
VAEPIRAGIYCRISLAALGDTTKTDDQERICRELAKRLGWDVTEVYQDNSRSAWQPGRKRPAWDTMLTDVQAGRITAIVVYHGDRLLRTHEDLLALIHLSRTRGIKLASPAGTRDLGNYDDQFILEIEASMAKRESANTSRRRKAQYERWRREGRVRTGGPGGRSFGFTTDGITHYPATLEELTEADLVREMARRIINGEGTRAIARDVNARGWRTPAGAEFTHTTIRSMLSRPRYAGLMPDGVSAAACEPILDRETWEQARAVLERKATGFAYATNRRRYLLSGIATCVCGSSLSVKSDPRRVTTYRCTRPGCRKTTRSVALLDAYVTGRVVGRLANPANPEGHLPSVPGLAAEWRALSEERAAVEAMITDHRKGRVHLLLGRLDSLDTRIAELRELTRADAAARLRGAHTGITAEGFNALPLGTRRALVSACYQVVVLPASKRGPGFRTEDVRMEPRVPAVGVAHGERGGGGGDTDSGEGGEDTDELQVPARRAGTPVGGGDAGGLP